MIVITRIVDLADPVRTETLRGCEFKQEQNAHTFKICVKRDGSDVTLTGSVSANILLANGDGLTIAGSIENGAAVVTLPQAAYEVPGRFLLAIYSVQTGQTTAATVKTCIYACMGSVVNTYGETQYDPGQIIPDAETLAAYIEACQEATNDAEAAAEAGVRTDTAVQGLNATQKSNARANIDAASSTAYYAEHSTLPQLIADADLSKLYIASNGKWAQASGGSSQVRAVLYKIPTNCTFISITTGENGGVVAFAQNGNRTSGDSVVFSDSYPERMIISDARKTIVYTRDNTMAYLYLQTHNASEDISPADVHYVLGNGPAIEAAWYSDELTTADLAWTMSENLNYSGEIRHSNGMALSQFVPVGSGCRVVCNMRGASSAGKQYLYGLHLHVRGVWQSVVTPDYGAVYDIPAGITEFRIVFGRNESSPAITMEELLQYCDVRILHKRVGWLSGKRVSIIGASDSTFAGYIPEGNNAYYTGDNYGIVSVGNCWWYIAISQAGGVPLINDSWSGATVATGVREATTTNEYRPFVDTRRCQNLHAYQHGGTSGTDTEVTASNIDSLRHSPWDADQTAWTVGEYVKRVDPDVIIVNGGGNDYVFEAPMGTYNGHTALDTTATGTFREAYAILLNRIQSEYPNALVVCTIPIYLIRPAMSSSADKAQVNVNGLGLTYLDYQNAIREIAALKGCQIIDLFSNGFSRYNYYSTYASDSSTATIHPNQTGHLVIGMNAGEQLKRICGGLVLA